MSSYLEPSPIEKIVAIASYLTMGLAGFIWFIIAVFTKSSLKPFLRYHVYQSIFLAIIYFLISTFLTLVLGLLSYIPIVKTLVGGISFFFMAPLIGSFSLIALFIFAVQLYLIIGVLQNNYSYIPWVSDVINYNVRR